MVSFRLNVRVIAMPKKKSSQVESFKLKISDLPFPDFATVLCYNFVGHPSREIT